MSLILALAICAVVLLALAVRLTLLLFTSPALRARSGAPPSPTIRTLDDELALVEWRWPR